MDSVFMEAFYNAFDNDETKQAFIDAGLPPVETMDKYRGQPLHPESFELFALPAIFVGSKVVWKQTGKKYNGLCTFDFHIVLDKTWEISNIATNREIGMKQTDLLKAIRLTLDGITSASTGSMNRASEIEHDADVVIYQIMSYTAAFYDDVIIGSGNTVMGTLEKLSINGKLVDKL